MGRIYDWELIPLLNCLSLPFSFYLPEEVFFVPPKTATVFTVSISELFVPFVKNKTCLMPSASEEKNRGGSVISRQVKDEPKPNSVVMFVHGFNSSAKCWDKLIALLNADARISSQFELRTFQYETGIVKINPLRRIPRIREISQMLSSELSWLNLQEQELTLVGHSQGGIVIQDFLVQALLEGKGETLRNIRQVILMATPNLGSTLLSPLRKLISIFSFNPQERMLRVLNPEIQSVQSVVLEKIVNAKSPTANSCPIPFHIFYGVQDNVVVEASAKGNFAKSAVTPVSADHFTIVEPKDSKSKLYSDFVNALIEPVGHVNVFEIDTYETQLQLQPCLDRTEASWQAGEKKRTIRCDNFALVDRSIKFSQKNQCTAPPFLVRYRTRNNGFIKYEISHPNEASPEESGKYADDGSEIIFRFTPKSGAAYRLKVEVYGGFGKGNRDIHFHLDKDCYCKVRKYRLDLTSYITQGFSITGIPKLYFHSGDLEHSEICKQRGYGREIAPTQIDGSAIWDWELIKVRGGVIDLVWDVSDTPVQVGTN